MAILNNNPLVGASGNQGGYNINNSLRFRSSASAYLSRTPASATNRKTYTFSVWVKRGQLNTGNSNKPPHIIRTSSPETAIRFEEATDADKFRVYSLGAGGFSYHSSAVYRDCSAWYHIVVAVDTTQATASNRVKIYINGSQITAFSSATDPSQNYEGGINNNTAHAIGSAPTPTEYFDGYMAEVNFIDGLQLTPSDFGSTNSTTGVWQPKKYTGSYGTNGYYLPFSDIATTSGSNAGLGKDFSGNSNYWTTNNISVTSGTTYDAMTDSPTLTSATVANYCVLNPLDIIPSRTLPVISGGNLDASNGGSGDDLAHGTIAVSSGKWYFEMIAGTVPGATTHFVGWQVPVPSPVNGGLYRNNGLIYDFSAATTSAPTYTANDIIGCVVDVDAGKVWFSKNGTYVNSGNPAAGTNPAYTFTAGTLITPALAFDNIASTCTASVNFGQRPFAYTPPTGFNRLNTYNLPDSTIKKGNSYMDATAYTGNGVNRSIANGGSFLPDLLWIKKRNSAFNHRLNNTITGTSATLFTNNTDAETTWGGVDAFLSAGFSVSNDSSTNANGDTYVAWQWNAGNNTTSSNTSGSITSTVSVNTTAGFSIVTYTGNGTNGATIGHGLGVAPRWVIVKRRNSSGDDWLHYHISLGATQSIAFDTNAAITSSTRWNNTTPSSTVITLGTSTGVNASGATYVAYCWAEIAGFSRFGSYTGNGSTDGPFVYTGFRPKFIMYKITSAAGGWVMLDTSRTTYNVTDKYLLANAADAEGTFNSIDILSNGFKVRNSDASNNPNGGTVVYMAFAENPFKNSLAR